MATALVRDGELSSPTPLTALWRKRIEQAREARKAYEPAWLSNLAFAAGKHYLMWDRVARQLVLPRDLEEQMGRGELYTADVLTERRMRILGELSADDDRPELLLVDDDKYAEDFQTQANRAVGYGWDYEWRGDDVLLEMRRILVDLGTAAVRVRFDPTVGPVKQDQVPFHQGRPVLDPDQARELLQNGPRPDVEMRTIHEGRIRWEPLSPFNLLVPAGIEDSDDFPWEVIVRPVPITRLKEQYGAKADGLHEDTDIGNLLGVDARSEGAGRGPHQGAAPRLRDHVWLYTCFQHPTVESPQGQTVVLASNEYQLLDLQPALPVCAPDGSWRSGVTYFHWWRATGRFWSRSLVDNTKDVQRRINKRTNQIDKTIDRGQPYVIVDKNGNAHKRKGWPMEIIAVEPTERAPQPVSGVQPGSWMYSDKADALADLDRASTVGDVAMGQNPTNVNTYSQLALLAENESVKRQVISKEHALAKGRLVEDSLWFIRQFWGPDKQIMLTGDDDRVQAELFNATKIPAFYIVRTAKGAAKPRSQAADLTKIDNIWTAGVNALVVQQNGPAWVRWYYDSLNAGEPLELPEDPGNEQADKAQLENHLLAMGQPVDVAYYDPIQIHLPFHRDAQVAADMAGEAAVVAAIEQHIQQHLQMEQQKSMQQAQLAAAAAPAQAALADGGFMPQPVQPAAVGPGAPMTRGARP